MIRTNKIIVSACLALLLANGAFAQEVTSASVVEQVIASNTERLPGDADRDSARHPAELIAFLGLAPNMTVAEINPGGGWYSRILAPYVRDQGKYIGLEHHPDIYKDRYPNYAEGLRAFPGKVKDNPSLYGDNALGAWIPSDAGLPAASNSLDLVIAVRALHNWIEADFFDAAADQVWQMLKPNGVFGIVQHRIDEDFNGSFEDAIAKGRWKQSDIIKAIEAQDFEFIAASEMNANPRDTKDYPEGVWTLPPSYELGDKDREKYAAIGESDRMTLKFRKVAR